MAIQLKTIAFIGILLFFSINIYSQDEEDASLIINIKKSLQDISRLSTTLRKKVLPGQKEKIKSGLIKKLQYPEFLKQKMILIEDEFEQKYYLIKSKKQELQKAYQNNIILQSYLNNIIYKYSNLLPFTFPDLKRQLKSIEENIINSDLKNNEELLRYYMEFIKSITGMLLHRYLNFWLFFKKFFVENEEIYKHLYNDLCPNEIHTKPGSNEKVEIFPIWIDEYNIHKAMDLNLEIPNLYVLNSYSYSDKNRFFYLSKKLALKKYEDDFFEKNFAEIRKNSICYNLSILQLYSEMNLKIPDYAFDIYKCMEAYFGGENTYKKLCSTLPTSLIKLYENSKIYFYYQNRILKKKILPEIFDMCYNKCACGKYNVNCYSSDKISNINEGYILDLLMKLFKNENEMFMMKLNNFIEGINTLTYGKKVENKCNSIKNVKQIVKEINSNNIFISNYKKVYDKWINSKKNDVKEHNNIINKLLDIANSIDKLKLEFDKLTLKSKFIQIFEHDKDAICKFVVFTEIFSRIGYDNVINISYYDLIRHINDEEEKRQFTGLVIYKTITLANTIKYSDKEVRFFNFSFDFSNNFSSMSNSLNTLSEYLYGVRTSSLFDYYAGLLTFFDYYLFFLNKFALVEKFSDSKISDFSNCLLNKKDLFSCILVGLDKSNKIYLKIVKKFFTKRRVNVINARNLGAMLHKMNPRRANSRLYEVIDEAMECCQKGTNIDNIAPQCDNAVCSIKYQSLTYIRKKGEERLKEILGTKFFNFLRKEIKKQ